MASEAYDKKPGAEKKWTPEAERDLLMVMLCAGSSGGTISANWAVVEAGMSLTGYDFSKSALTQRFGKNILKNYRIKHGDDIVSRISSSDTGAASAKTPRSGAKKRAGVKSEAGDEGSPTKKGRAKKGDVKDEEDVLVKLENSVIMDDTRDKDPVDVTAVKKDFEEWMTGLPGV